MIPCPHCGASLEENMASCPLCGGMLLPQEAEGEQADVPPVPASKKLQKKKWVFLGILIGVVLILGGILVISLISRTDPNVGSYIGVKAERDGTEVDMQELFGGKLVVKLQPRGVCKVTLGKKTGSGKWTLDGYRLTIEDGASTFTGTLKDDRMTLKNVMGYDFVLTRDGAGRSDGKGKLGFHPIFSQGASVQTDWWNGDWYGWWMISSCDKGYQELENQWWDCCASIELDKNDAGHILIWDEDLPRDNPLAEFDFARTAEDSEALGIAQSQSGYFMDMELTNGEITMNPGSSPYENLLAFDGWYRDEKGSFFFEIYLRPWGQRWEDWAEEEGEDILPYYYKDFYLPAIENGELPPDDIAEAWSGTAEEE